MKALKKAEYNPSGARDPKSSDREPPPPFSGTPAQAANAFVAPPAPRPALLMSALLLGALVLGAAGIWFLLRPVPQPPIYLRQPPLPSSNNLPQQVTPQASILIPSENTRPISTEAPISELPATPESAPLPPPPVELKTTSVAVPKNPARALAPPATEPLMSPVEPDLLNAYQALQRGE